ncbi:SusD-like starch-binding protein associating with outer membrane [Chitinophaga skermanii]|uniref:SusD-like starch-binding protein associating with outer membrane n=1 Tax=Chitinophaga skermanii TaxID=331697 RepID=A0A327QVD6_9BACT|nr:RagB/SusD family nutrient uptake outer membrane protein [Chitinophaga skermanii]RAJ08579.1 SusD-like starch-binding protein associating with outer membrane [Chitinophaga skermanii]
MKKYALYILAGGMVAGTGCKKFLETTPDMRTELDTPTKVAELLATAYPKGNYITFAEAMSDNSEDKGTNDGTLVNVQPWRFEDVQDRDQDSPDNYWFQAYSAIAAANHALAVINKQTDKAAAYRASKGEALVARAYAHFMLVTLYAKTYDPATAASYPGVPYITEPETKVVQKYERKTVQYVYEQIEKDLLEGMPLIDDNSYKGAPKYHFTKTAAFAFASRFYLFKKDYAKVLQYANAAFPNGNIKPYLRQVNVASERNKEPLVKRAEYTKATTKANLLLVETTSWWARNLRGYRYGMNRNVLTKTAWSRGVSGGLWGFSFYGSEETLFTPKFEEHFVKEDINANIGIGVNVIPLFTAEEVLFNRIEANIYLGDYAAVLKDMNEFGSLRFIVNDTDNPNYDPVNHVITQDKILAFYKTNDIKLGFIKTILDFRRTEFLQEGMRWFDILRYNLPVEHVSFNLKDRYILGPDDPRRILQIPQESQLSGLEMNPR